jgi:hypothetical protein
MKKIKKKKRGSSKKKRRRHWNRYWTKYQVILKAFTILFDQISEEDRLPHRFDFHLQTSAVNFSYLTLMNAHFSYWTNLDLVAFILNQLYAKKSNDEPTEQKLNEQKEHKSYEQKTSSDEHSPKLDKKLEIDQKLEQKA